MDSLKLASIEYITEKFLHFIKKHNKILFAAFIFFIAIIIGFLSYQKYESHLLNESSSMYYKTRDVKNNLLSIEKLSEKNNIYGTLSKLRLASFHLKEKEYNKAIYWYQKLTLGKNAPPLYKEFAELMILKIKISINTINAQDAIHQLNEYIKKTSNFKDIARITLAALLLKNNDIEDGNGQLDLIITNINSPDSLKHLSKIIKNDE